MNYIGKDFQPFIHNVHDDDDDGDMIINLSNAYFYAAYSFQYNVFVRIQLTSK